MALGCARGCRLAEWPALGVPSFPGGAVCAPMERQDLLPRLCVRFLRSFRVRRNPNNPEIPNWPSYELGRRATMALDLPTKIIDDPRGEERRMFETVAYENPGT